MLGGRGVTGAASDVGAEAHVAWRFPATIPAGFHRCGVMLRRTGGPRNRAFDVAVAPNWSGYASLSRLPTPGVETWSSMSSGQFNRTE